MRGTRHDPPASYSAGMRVLLTSAWILFVAACSGGATLSDEELNSRVEELSDSLTECAGGEVSTLEVEVHIAADGEVEEARATGSARAAACVERIIQTWTFPSAEAGVEALLPLTLTPPSEG
ncbi:MAG: hypothetical protein ACI9KE_001488 [Polyangiales bacterium]